MKRVLVIGLGLVGKALYEIIRDSKCCSLYGYDVDPSKTINSLEEIPRPIDYIHITIPFNNMDEFIKNVGRYIDMFKPRIVFIHSTVAPGTTRRVHEEYSTPVAYTPIRGKQPYLKEHILFWPKWVTVLPQNILEEAIIHLREIGLKAKPCKCNPETLELAKLWETVYRALMITAWQEIHRIARRVGADIGVVAEFIAEVHRVLRDRPVYYPDYISSHCLIPNTIILKKVYESKLLDFILESNELRRKELEDYEVKREVEELKRIAEELANRDYYEGRV